VILAHVAGIEYDFPLPVWVFATAGAAAVLASAPAAAFAVRMRRDDQTREAPLLARLHLGPACIAVTSILLIVALVAGFFSSELGFFNAAIVLFWVDLWVGLGVASALLGNVWDFVSPLSAAGRALERRLAIRGVPTRAYPEWLGVWPSTLLLLLFSWFELVWDEGDRAPVVATAITVYLVVQLAAMAVFGAEVWLARGELFTAVARTFGRLAPLELYVKAPSGACRADRCVDESERIGCPSCWLDADPAARGIRLRLYGAGIRREPRLGPGGAAFVVAMLATVVYDGLRNTFANNRIESFLIDVLPGFEQAADARETLVLMITVGGLVLLFLAVIALVAVLQRVSIGSAAETYAPTLIPIAAVYFLAHYVLYLFYVGQVTPGVVLDPFDLGWFPDYRPWTGVPGSIVWAIQGVVIVWGHIVAVIAAHRVALPDRRSAGVALGTQLPLVALMVIYTFAGLWVLGEGLTP
jgi:hypothetical protein